MLTTLSLSLHREEHTRLLDLTPPKHNAACFYQTTHEVNVLVSYHEPTGMVNITQILNLFGTRDVRTALAQLDTISCREIRGSPQWDGSYIHRSVLGEVFSHLSLQMKHNSWDDNKALHPVVQFFGEEHSISIATEEMIGLILFNPQSQTITWGPRILTLQEAIRECENHGLLIARDTLIHVASRSSESGSTLHYTDDDIMNLFEQPADSDFPTEAASHNSFQSQETVKFTPRRKKGKASEVNDVPVLPQRKGKAERDVVSKTPVEKVEEWIKVGEDIRPTRFTRGQASRSTRG
jgi:hypothetical protein